MNATAALKYDDPRWQRKRLECMQRDDWACVGCGSTSKQLHVHHIRYRGNLWDSELHELQTLCVDCHADLGKHPKGGLSWERHNGQRFIRLHHCPMCSCSTFATLNDAFVCKGCNGWKSLQSHDYALPDQLPPLSSPRINGRLIRTVYLAGKMNSDWRDSIIKSSAWKGAWTDGDSDICGFNAWDDKVWPTRQGKVVVPGKKAIDFVGPYWDPSIFGGHCTAMGMSAKAPNTHATGSIQSRTDIIARCGYAIRSCDLFFAWVDTEDAHGTLVEIGFASALDTVVVVVAMPTSLSSDLMWFPASFGDYFVSGCDAGTAWNTLWEHFK